MDSPLGPRKHIRIYAVEARRLPTSNKIQPAAGKGYDNNFGDSKELHMVDYLPSNKTIIGQYYAEIMFKLYDAISQKRREKMSLSVWFLHDNTPVHKSLVAQQAV